MSDERTITGANQLALPGLWLFLSRAGTRGEKVGQIGDGITARGDEKKEAKNKGLVSAFVAQTCLSGSHVGRRISLPIDCHLWHKMAEQGEGGKTAQEFLPNLDEENIQPP